jgi:Flp pilus assembly pilin Flp
MLRRLLASERGLESVENAIVAGLILSGVALLVAAIAVWITDRHRGLPSAAPG